LQVLLKNKVKEPTKNNKKQEHQLVLQNSHYCTTIGNCTSPSHIQMMNNNNNGNRAARPSNSNNLLTINTAAGSPFNAASSSTSASPQQQQQQQQAAASLPQFSVSDYECPLCLKLYYEPVTGTSHTHT